MAYGHVYVLRNEISVASLTTILQVTAGPTCPFIVLDSAVTQQGSTTSVQTGVRLVRKTVNASVTTATIGTNLFKLRTGDPNPALALATTGTGWMMTGAAGAYGTDGDVPGGDGFNVLNGWAYLPVPEERLFVPASGTIALVFPITPTSVESYVFRLTLMELGT